MCQQKAYNTVFYACRRSNGLYGDNNVYYNKKYIKLYPNNVVVEIPSWWNDETIPGSRIFKLEKAYKVPALLSQSVLDDQDMTSGDHCQGSPVQVYQLHMVSLPLLRRYAFQQVLKSFNLSQLKRVYQKVYGKKCPVKSKKAILKILQRK